PLRADRRLGLGPVARAARPAGPGAAHRRDGHEVRAGERAAAAALVGLPADAAAHRVLARPPVPPARAPRLRPRRRRLDREEAVPVTVEFSLLPLREKVAAKRPDEGSRRHSRLACTTLVPRWASTPHPSPSATPSPARGEGR